MAGNTDVLFIFAEFIPLRVLTQELIVELIYVSVYVNTSRGISLCTDGDVFSDKDQLGS